MKNKIFSGDEFLCLKAYREAVKGLDPLSSPKLFVSRSSKDTLPESNHVIITAGYLHKKADYVFDYIKVDDYTSLKKYVREYSDLYHMIPVSEFNNLKNPQYKIQAYDFMLFKHSVLPFLQRKLVATDRDATALCDVFQFADCFLQCRVDKLDTIYADVIYGDDESPFWMAENTIQLCLNILSGESKDIHPYRLKLYSPIAYRLGFEKLFQLKKIAKDFLDAIRTHEHNYVRVKLLASLYNLSEVA